MTTAQVGIRQGNTIIPYAAGSIMPAGTIISYSGSIAGFTSTSVADSTTLIHKDGWAVCNGASIPFATYSQLYARLSTVWNAATNTLTGSAQSAPADTGVNFRIPNLQGVFLRGVADSNDVILGIYKPDQFQGHIHGVSQNYATFQTGSAANVLGTGPASINQSIIGAPTDDGTSGTPRTGYETSPKQVGIYYLVKLYDNLSAADVYIAPASGATPGIVDNLAQHFHGVKDFGDGIKLNTGDTLSTYAVNTWTPIVTLVGGSNNTVPVYTTKLGRYTRIGNRVFCEIILSGDDGNEGAGTGTVAISLPFEAVSSGVNYWGLGYGYNSTTEFQLLPGISAGASIVAINYWNAGVLTALTGAGQNNASRGIQISIVYEAV
jgi:hypothetical protein